MTEQSKRKPVQPLTAAQRQAASMLGSGMTQKATAEALGVDPKTVSRWTEREDFKALARKAREVLLGEMDSPEAVLRAALHATKGTTGRIVDWSTRLQAAKILLGSPVATTEAQEEARRVERIYVQPDEEDDGSARPDPRTDPHAGGAKGSPTPAEGVTDSAAEEQQEADA